MSETPHLVTAESAEELIARAEIVSDLFWRLGPKGRDKIRKIAPDLHRAIDQIDSWWKVWR